MLVEDIVDTGKTVAKVANYLNQRNPLSIKVASLVNKEKFRQESVVVDFPLYHYSGGEFVVGYGLDYGEKYRNLPYLAEL